MKNSLSVKLDALFLILIAVSSKVLVLSFRGKITMKLELEKPCFYLSSILVAENVFFYFLELFEDAPAL